MSLSMSYREWMYRTITDLALTVLPITVEYAEVQVAFPGTTAIPSTDLEAQAKVENITLVSADPGFDPYGIKRLW